MACATASCSSTSADATIVRASSRPQPCVHAFVRPAVRPAGSRLQQLNRAHPVKAVNAGCWGPVGACGPQTNYRRWTSGDARRSFDKWAEQASNNMWFPVDVIETAQQYTFVADVPGLGKNDIKVQVNKDRVLSISGERQQRSQSSSASSASSSGTVDSAQTDTNEQEVQKKRQERRFGTFKRTWELPADADISQIKAAVEQGVLTLTITRTQPAEPEVTTIPVN